MKTFNECYKELSDYLYVRGIATDKVKGDPVYELAKTYAQHEQRTFEEEHDEPSELMSTKKQFHFTLDENQRDNLCEILDRELDSLFEFYRGDSEAITELENYTSFQLLKQMDWPLEDEIEMIEKAKQGLKQ